MALHDGGLLNIKKKSNMHAASTCCNASDQLRHFFQLVKCAQTQIVPRHTIIKQMCSRSSDPSHMLLKRYHCSGVLYVAKEPLLSVIVIWHSCPGVIGKKVKENEKGCIYWWIGAISHHSSITNCTFCYCFGYTFIFLLLYILHLKMWVYCHFSDKL